METAAVVVALSTRLTTSGASWFDALLLLALVVTAIPAYYAWRRRDNRGATPLFWVLVGTMLWILPALLASLAGTDAHTRLAVNAWFVGIVICCPAFLFFALEYTGYSHYLRPSLYAGVAIHAVLALALVWLDPGGHAFVEISRDADQISGYTLRYGPIVYLNVAVWYAMLAVGAIFVVRLLLRSRHVHQQQTLLILTGLFTPWIANLAFLFGPVETDFTPVGYAVLGATFTVAIHRYRLTDLAPIAWETVANNISDAVVVLDTDDRVLELNDVAARSYGLDRSAVVGTAAADVFADFPQLYDRFRDVRETSEEVEVPTNHGTRIVDLEVTPVVDRNDRPLGRVFVAHDITEQQRRQRALERQNERLDEFAGLLSHDLRNPINVAQGYVDVAVAEYDDPEHVEEIATSLDRMETLVEDALTLARESRTVTDPEPVSVETVVRDAWTNVDTDDATLTVGTDLQTIADRSRLLRVFENLIRNAIEHGGPDVTVTVGTVERDANRGLGTDDVGIYVADDGPGVPTALRDEVFESGVTTAEDGTGLGLSIVENVVEAHGWELSVGESVDGGARFEITGIEPTPRADGRAGESGVATD